MSILTNSIIVVISLAASAITIWTFIRRDRITWRKVAKLVVQLLDEIRSDGFAPDYIIGVGRGGSIVAGMLAGNGGHIPLFVVDTILEREDGVNEVAIRNKTLPNVKGKKVLLVVGEVFSGQDLITAKQHMQNSEYEILKTMSMFYHPASTIKPDYIGMKTKKPESAPWRITDAYRSARH